MTPWVLLSALNKCGLVARPVLPGRTREAETGGRAPGHPQLYSEFESHKHGTLSKTKKQKHSWVVQAGAGRGGPQLQGPLHAEGLGAGDEPGAPGLSLCGVSRNLLMSVNAGEFHLVLLCGYCGCGPHTLLSPCWWLCWGSVLSLLPGVGRTPQSSGGQEGSRCNWEGDAPAHQQSRD